MKQNNKPATANGEAAEQQNISLIPYIQLPSINSNESTNTTPTRAKVIDLFAYPQILNANKYD